MEIAIQGYDARVVEFARSYNCERVLIVHFKSSDVPRFLKDEINQARCPGDIPP